MAVPRAMSRTLEISCRVGTSKAAMNRAIIVMIGVNACSQAQSIKICRR